MEVARELAELVKRLRMAEKAGRPLVTAQEIPLSIDDDGVGVVDLQLSTFRQQERNGQKVSMLRDRRLPPSQLLYHDWSRHARYTGRTSAEDGDCRWLAANFLMS